MARWIPFLFVLGSFATPVHLAVDAHDAPYEGHPDDHHEPHPSADHVVVAARVEIQPLPALFETGILELHLPAPVVASWIPAVEADAIGPPDAPESPPRSPRAPPL